MSRVVLLEASGVQLAVQAWPVAAIAVFTLLIRVMFSLRAERQRRTTLIDLVERAPRGSVISQEKGYGGPAMTVWIGERHERDHRDLGS